MSDDRNRDIEARLYEAARNAVASAQQSVQAIEEADEYVPPQHYDDHLESAGNALSWHLRQAYRLTCALLETMGLSVLLRDFRDEFAEAGDLRATTHIDEGLLISPAADVLNSYHDVVRATLTDTQASAVRIALIRRTVSNIPHIVRDFGALPTKEADVTNLLKTALSWSFPDTILNPPIPQLTKTYKPDIGIRSDQVAIEVKFVDSQIEANRVLGEIYTDMNGYGGDPSWTSFIAIIYQTGPFLRKDKVEEEARRVGAKKDWKIYVETGIGKRPKPKPKPKVKP